MRLTSRHRAGSAVVTLPALSALAATGCPVGPVRVVPAGTSVLRVAMGGYEPVSDFLPDGPKPGSDRFATEWGGPTRRFASGTNLGAFRKDPAIFAVLGERLSLFRDAERRAACLADPTLASRAEAIWPSLRRLSDDPAEDGPGWNRPRSRRGRIRSGRVRLTRRGRRAVRG